jgi:hypothetical protein
MRQEAGQKRMSQTTVTFTPGVVPLSDPEITNPWRGAYNWYDSQAVPGWPFLDSYKRYTWREIEPTEGHYDFSQIDQELALAQARHGKFGLRIMPAVPDTTGVPDYLMESMPHGGWFMNAYDGQPAYEPDWNDPNYIARAEALINALGERYNNDPRLGWIDIFPYGDWGEWHTFGFPDTIAPMSAENQQQLIDTNIQAFSNKRLVMFTPDSGALTYALSRSSKIGIRVDCLGVPNMGGIVDQLSNLPLAQDRWKTAPLIFEFCSEADFQVSLKQVETYHGAMVSDGNFGSNSYQSYSNEDQEYLKRTFLSSGYRFILNRMIISSPMQSGTRFTVTTIWSNVNVTPAYNLWNVMVQLRNSSGTVAWQGKSALDLQTLLPTTSQTRGIDTPLTLADSFNLPDSISTGSYTVSVQILDPSNYYDPLRLAIQGRNSDGSYSLGKVTII